MHMACSMSNDVNTAEVSTQPVGQFLQPSCRLEQKACWPCWPHAHPTNTCAVQRNLPCNLVAH